MILKLKVLGGNQAGKELVVKKHPFLIGRSEECHLRPHTDEVSRKHCALEEADGKISARDLGSRTGTFVNGNRLTAPQVLKTGDKLTVGPLDFEIVLTVEIKQDKRPAVRSIKEAMSRVVEGTEPELDIDNWLAAPAEKVKTSHDDVLADIRKQSEQAQSAVDAAKQAAAKPVLKTDSRSSADDAIRRLTGNR